MRDSIHAVYLGAHTLFVLVGERTVGGTAAASIGLDGVVDLSGRRAMTVLPGKFTAVGPELTLEASSRVTLVHRTYFNVIRYHCRTLSLPSIALGSLIRASSLRDLNPERQSRPIVWVPWQSETKPQV